MVSVDGVCKDCETGCDKCCEKNIDKCLECTAPLVLHEGDCLNHCPEGFVELESEPGKCTKCGDENCLQCCKKDKDTCKVCEAPYLLKDGDCVEDCGDGYSSDGSKCAPCEIKECQDCEGNKEDCKKCNPPLVLFVDGKLCIDICPDRKSTV